MQSPQECILRGVPIQKAIERLDCVRGCGYSSVESLFLPTRGSSVHDGNQRDVGDVSVGLISMPSPGRIQGPTWRARHRPGRRTHRTCPRGRAECDSESDSNMMRDGSQDVRVVESSHFKSGIHDEAITFIPLHDGRGGGMGPIAGNCRRDSAIFQGDAPQFIAVSGLRKSQVEPARPV
jgi:hypothetical protein